MREIFSLNIKKLLIIGFAGAVLVPVAILGTMAVRKSTAALESEAYGKLLTAANLKRDGINGYLSKRMRDAELLALSPMVQDALVEYAAAFGGTVESDDGADGDAAARADRYFTDYTENTDFRNVFLIDTEGNVVYTVTRGSDLGENIDGAVLSGTSLKTVVGIARNENRAAIADITYYPPADTNAFLIACPVDRDGERLGVIALRLGTEEISARMLAATGVGETAQTYLVGPDYKLRSDTKFDQTILDHTDFSAAPRLRAIVDEGIAGQFETGEYGMAQTTDYMGREVFTIWDQVDVAEHLKWAIVSDVPVDDIMAPAHALTRNIIISALLLGLVFVAVGVLIAYRISSGIDRVVGGMDRLADRDLTYRLPVRGNDEIAKLSRAFNSTCENLGETMRTVGDASSAVGSASEQVGATAQESARGSQSLSLTVEQIAQGAQDQASQLGTIRDRMVSLDDSVREMGSGAEQQRAIAETAAANAKAMAQSAGQVADLSEQVASASTQSSQVAREGAEGVSQAVEAMKRIQDHAQHSTELIQELGRQSEAIGEIVGVIEDVAEQTNLLALNAAIEAARAGEHGKGFAVVADEVRKLAERAATSTGEITNIVRQIQDGIGQAVEAQDENRAQTDEGAALIVRAGEALESILASVDDVTQAMAQVTAAAQQMSAGVADSVTANEELAQVAANGAEASANMTKASAEVAAALDSISAVIEQNTASTQEASAYAEEQSAGGEEMAASAEELAASAQSLQGLVSQFRCN
ncbi:MAG: HAMP domain-containing protein [Armatimonadia bacterium]|nr:HAMP domain-containing protein [Armatimonadia bacterium]